MGKSKAPKAAKAEEPKAITAVKGGNVTKSSQTPKSKSKEVAKAVAAKAKDVKKSSKKAVKEETPSSSESESDTETSESSASSDESDAEEPVPKTNGAAKVNGKANGVAAKKDESSEEEDSDDSSEGSDDEVPAKANGVAAKDDSDSEEDSDQSGSSDEDEAPKAKANGAVDTKKAEAKDESNDDSEDDSEDGSDSSSEEEEEEQAPSKKRKAEVESTPVAKKAKADPSTPADATKNLFVGNLSWSVDEEWLKSEFEKFGTLEGVRIVTDRDSGRSKGFGYVEFANAEDAVKAHDAMKGTELDNRPLNVDYSKPREPKTFGDRSDRANKFGDKIGEPTDTLFVGNLSFDADQDTVSSEFNKHGEVIGVRLPTDQQSGALKGFGYVQFASVDDAKTALTGMAGAQIAGRVIRLDYSQPRANNGGSPRGGRGDFGGRGRGRGGGRGDFRGGRGGGRGDFRGGRGGSTNRGGFGDFKGKKMTF